MVVVHHLPDIVDIARECQRRGYGKIPDALFVSDRSLPSAVFDISGLQINLLVSRILGQFTEEGLVVGIGLVVGNLCPEIVPQPHFETELIRAGSLGLKVRERVNASLLKDTAHDRDRDGSRCKSRTGDGSPDLGIRSANLQIGEPVRQVHHLGDDG